MTHAIAALAAYQEIARMTEPDAKPRLESPLDCIDWLKIDPEMFADAAQSITLRGNKEADTMLRGWPAIIEAFDGRDGRYTEFRLYRLAAGGWAACVGFRSDNPGELSLWTVRKVETIAELMDAWGWTVPARKIAKEQGWDVRRRL